MNDEAVPAIKPSRPEEQPMIPQPLVELHGWGRASGTMAHLAQIDSVADAVSALRTSDSRRGVVPRGLGRSYGDAAQNAGGTALDLTKMNRILSLEAAAEPPTVTVQAGVSLDLLMRALLPFGLWVPVLPGTRQVTVGGAIAADVHGKNHHTEGSFGNHVRSLDLLMADGQVRKVTPDGETAGLFWATIGGMGLTGAVLRATVALQRTETAYFSVDTDRCSDIDDLMQKMADGDQGYTYSVAWFDAVTKGRHMGRAVLTRGNKARLAELPVKLKRDPLKFVAPSLGTVPGDLPQPDDQQGDRQGVQRSLVSQGAQASSRRTAKHHPVLPPARHRGRVESCVRAERLPAVPIRGALRARTRRSGGVWR